MNPVFETAKSLRLLNTFGLPASASLYSSFQSEAELRMQLAEVKKQGKPLLILGGGSNILFTKDFDGIVLKNEIKGIQRIHETDSDVLIQAGAGEVWHQFVLYCVDHGYAGIENLSLIPGTVGAAPIQNIGAYGVEIKDVLEYVEGIDIETLTRKKFMLNECRFGYRDSIFKKDLKGKFIVTAVAFRLKKQASVNTSYGAIQQTLKEMNISVPTLKDVSNAVIHIRSTKLPDPAVLGNAGSFFKNPEIPAEQFEELKKKYPDIVSFPGSQQGLIKVPAGWLIEKSGWKGKTLGNAGVHKMQALVIVNLGNAKGEEIVHLSLEVRKTVKELFGIELEPEVNFL